MNLLEKDYLRIRLNEIKEQSKKGKKSILNKEHISWQHLQFHYIEQMIDKLLDVI